MKLQLEKLFKQTIQQLFGDEFADYDPFIQTAKRAEYGDYQANFALALAKQLKQRPQDIAEKVIAQLKNHPMLAKLELSGPGFINITIDNAYLNSQLNALIKDPRLGVAEASHPETIVVDYGGANVAKEMHVGHLRSPFIGDAIVRILKFLGHSVIKQNHLGDWGTQFGMLIEYLIDINQFESPDLIQHLNDFYKQAKQKFDADSEFAERARQRVVALQNEDAFTYGIWQRLVNDSKHLFQDIYDRINVLLTEDDARGESFYNSMLGEIATALEKSAIAKKDDGAMVIFLDEFLNAENQPSPFIIRKKDGGYLYATTDLAAAKFRIDTLKANRLIYVTDARQKQHFAMLFSVLRKANWAPADIKLEHVPFGAILGEDHKPLKTRSGELIRLTEVLDKAEERAKEITRSKNPNLSEEDISKIAKILSISALKYADLRVDKIKDYIFSWDKMLSFEGNTAPYLQSAYVRILSIFRKGNITPVALSHAQIFVQHPVEHSLAIKLLEFPELVYFVSDHLSLHKLCDYLYELAATFHQFYEHCAILSAETESMRHSRLLLASLVANTLALGLNLLGIQVLEFM